jgi:putative Ca2+/H+ antiporter (TMEM165/GDT1 family)
MSLTVALTVFALILPAELPDKTFVATLVLSTRYPGWPVFTGVAAAFAVQTTVAVAAGGLVSLLPPRPVHAFTALLFAIGAVLVLRSGGQAAEEEREVTEELADAPATASFRRAALTSFGVLFAAEWGDLSQVLTASFAAKYGDAVAVFVGAMLALWVVAGLGIVGGRALLRVVPLEWVRRGAAVAFGVLAVVTGLEAAGVL